MCAFRVEGGGEVAAWRRVNRRARQMGESRECRDKRPTLEDEAERRGEEGRGAETGGMCFPSGPSGAAFHCRYPEGDPHWVPRTPWGHHGSTPPNILTNHCNKLSEPQCTLVSAI